jgi:thioesterase domain-containing protein
VPHAVRVSAGDLQYLQGTDMMVKSIGSMIKQLTALVGTQDLNGWETGFVTNVASQTDEGTHTLMLTEAQVEKVTSIYAKHFGDSE